MTRKHFEAIAEAIRNNIGNKTEREAIARALIPAMLQANAHFNSNRFIAACSGE